jgi:4-amino-4-deoxy-L-arabinose transferase-like glycosyltransferase
MRSIEEMRLSRRAWAIVAVILAILLLPSLFHPLGADQALFYVSGQKLLRGEVLYRDIADIKPALLYYLYALAEILFGGGESSIRILDLIVQGLTCWLMIRTVRRMGGGDLAAAIAPICYLLLYFGQGFQYPAQAEAYTGLAGLLMLQLLIFRRSIAGFFAIGLLVGALFLLKFTFGIFIPIVVAWEIVAHGASVRRLARLLLPMLAGFGCVSALFLLYLLLTHSLHAYQNISGFTGAYAQTELRPFSKWFKNLITLPTLHFADNYSLLLTMATVAGAALSMRRMRGAKEERSANFTLLVRCCVIAFAFLFATITIEAKYPPYHFMRIYPFGAILAASGIVAAIGILRRRYIAERYTWSMMPLLAAAFLLFGPFLRFGWHAIIPAWQGIRGPSAALLAAPEPYSHEAFVAMGRFIRSRRRPNDKLFVMSSQAGLAYLQAGVIPEFYVYHSQFVIAPFAAQEFRDSTRAYLLREQPRIIVLDEGDALPSITGSNATSTMAVRALPGVAALLDTAYSKVPTSIPLFGFYIRKEAQR